MRELCEVREVDEVLWIPSGANPAHALTKDSPFLAHIQLMTANRVYLTSHMGRTKA